MSYFPVFTSHLPPFTSYLSIFASYLPPFLTNLPVFSTSFPTFISNLPPLQEMQHIFLSCSFRLLLRYAYRCVYADTCSHIAHSASSKFLPSLFTFNHLKTWMMCVKVSPIFIFTWWTKSPLCLHPQFLDHQYFIRIRWRGEGKKRKTPDARPCARVGHPNVIMEWCGRCLKWSCEVWFLVEVYFLMFVACATALFSF